MNNSSLFAVYALNLYTLLAIYFHDQQIQCFETSCSHFSFSINVAVDLDLDMIWSDRVYFVVTLLS